MECVAYGDTESLHWHFDNIIWYLTEKDCTEIG